MKSFATRFPQVILQTVISSCSSRPARLSLNEGSQALEDVCSDVARRKNCIGRHVHMTICLKVLALSLKEKEVLSSRANKKTATQHQTIPLYTFIAPHRLTTTRIQQGDD